MAQQSFVYVIYMRTTAEKVWEALTEPEFTKRFWFGIHQETNWTRGAPWKLIFSDGRVADSGEILEIDPPRRLVLKWRNEFDSQMKSEGYTRCSITIEPEADQIKLTVAHEADRPHKLIDAVSTGWPLILSSLKSLLETGEALSRTGIPFARRQQAAG